jgi:hypothetical protein
VFLLHFILYFNFRATELLGDDVPGDAVRPEATRALRPEPGGLPPHSGPTPHHRAPILPRQHGHPSQCRAGREYMHMHHHAGLSLTRALGYLTLRFLKCWYFDPQEYESKVSPDSHLLTSDSSENGCRGFLFKYCYTLWFNYVYFVNKSASKKTFINKN